MMALSAIVELSSDAHEDDALARRDAQQDRIVLIDEIFKKKVSGNRRPSHVFLSLVESWNYDQMMRFYTRMREACTPKQTRCGDVPVPFQAHVEHLIALLSEDATYQHPAVDRLLGCYVGTFTSDSLELRHLLPLLDPECWLSDTEMTCIGVLIENKYQSVVFLGNDVWKGDNANTAYSRTITPERQARIDRARYLLSVVNVDDTHWALVVADRDAARVSYFDSYHGSFNAVIKTAARKKRFALFGQLLRRVMPDVAWPRVITVRDVTALRVEQRDSVSCGLYALHIGECIGAGMQRALFDDARETWDNQHFALRAHYALGLLTGRLRDLCTGDADHDACSEELA